MIGTLGPLTFVTSADTIRNFEDFSRKEAGRWHKHNVLGQKPLLEFLGPDTSTISFKMRLDAHWGVNPRKEMENILRMVRSGETHPLTIGGKRLGVNKWALKDHTQNWNTVDNKGRVIVAELTVSLEEYV